MTSGTSKKNKRPGRRKHVPQRTCVGCRAVRPKREMTRVVRTSEATVAIDPSGKGAGRGAYVCPQRGCWEKALKRHSLARALNVTLDAASQATLAAHAQTLPESLDLTSVSEEKNR